MEEGGPINVFSASFFMLTVQEPTFREALDWFQFAYNVDRSGAYMAPASTVFAHSEISEGGKLFSVILLHLRRLYQEAYGHLERMGKY